MANFPALSKDPVTDGYGEGAASDPTVRNQTYGGAVESYSVSTVTPWTWTLTFRHMTLTDRDILKDFEKNTARYGSTEFYWTNPLDNVTHAVKLAEPIKYSLDDKLPDLWKFTVILIEANPTSD